MNCESFQAILQDLSRDFLLDLQTRQEGLAHAEKCPRCAARLKDECRLLAGLEALAASFAHIQAPPAVEQTLLRAFRDRGVRAEEKESPDHVQEVAPKESCEKFDQTEVGAFPLAPGPSPRWGEGEVKTGSNSLSFGESVAEGRVRGNSRTFVKARIIGIAAIALLATGLAAWFSLQRFTHRPEQSIDEPKSSLRAKTSPQLSSRIASRVIAEVPKTTRSHSVQAKSGSRPVTRVTQLQHPALASQRPGTQDERDVEQTEVATEFLPLSYGDTVSSLQGGQLVRVRLPRTTLLTFGFPMSEERAPEPIKADVLLGEDGRARAIRFVH
jgi:hypothetical protein